MEKKRSVGVTVCGYILILIGILYGILVYVIPLGEGFLFPAGWTFGHRLLYTIFHLAEDTIFKNILTTFLKITILSFPLICIILGVGILKLKSWSRKWLISISIIYILVAVYCSKPLPPRAVDTLCILPPVLLYSFLIYFFTRPKVKEQFK